MMELNVHIPSRDASGAGKTGAETASQTNTVADTDAADGGKLQARTVNDTVTLSDGAQKVVNLARSGDLSEQIRNAPVDENFADTLRTAMDDMARIFKLFAETVKTAFSFFRR